MRRSRTTSPPTAATPRTDTGLDVVTGAFSYSGAALARALHGCRPRRPHHHRASRPSAGRHGDRGPPARLRRPARPGGRRSTEPRRSTTPTGCASPTAAVDHERGGRQLAGRSSAPRKRAGVQRIVHVSITHPSSDSPLPVLPGQGAGGAGARRERRLLRHCAPGHPLRRRRRPPQQHRLAAPPTAPCSPSAAAATTGSGASTSTTWRSCAWPWPPRRTTA